MPIQIQYGMFYMRHNIMPTWEDLRILMADVWHLKYQKDTYDAWLNLCAAIGEKITKI